jgi:xanthine dehydrogenase accessory factor
MHDAGCSLRAIVWGSSDIASAVAITLYRAGHVVVILDGPYPTTTRRHMAFSDAVFDGQAVLDGVTAVRVHALRDLASLLDLRSCIPLVVEPLQDLLAFMPSEFLIDARMRKRARPELLRDMAPLTIGLGPNFVAGETVDVAIETEWGDEIGAVITTGGTQPLRGEPRAIAGHARDRYVYAPVSGVFRSDAAIGDRVSAGQPIACIGETILRAPLGGALRGLTRDGVPVEEKTKVIEVDPRPTGAVITGIGERPAKIARGVLSATSRVVSGVVDA